MNSGKLYLLRDLPILSKLDNNYKVATILPYHILFIESVLILGLIYNIANNLINCTICYVAALVIFLTLFSRSVNSARGSKPDFKSTGFYYSFCFINFHFNLYYYFLFILSFILSFLFSFSR